MNTDQASSLRPRHPQEFSLGALCELFSLGQRGDLNDLFVTGVTMDSRDVQPGDLYVGLLGTNRHGAEFARQASERGAVAMLTDDTGLSAAGEAHLPVIVTDREPREILGLVAATVYRTTDIAAPVFGVTGTNGKTSVVYVLAELMQAAGLTVGLSSTAERRVADSVLTSNLTSPEASELHGLLARMLEDDVTGIVLEVSAHATARHRIDGVNFDVVAFNNLSHDHLDDFGNIERYFQAKQRLFTPEHASRGVVVVDSPYGVRLAREAQIPVTRLATEYGNDADWFLAVTKQSLDGVSFVLQGPEGAHFRGSVPIFGGFMAENAALALIMLHEAGFSLEQVASGLENGRIPVHIPGRLEEITAGGDGPRFFVDYGHTPGAFTAMLDALDEVVTGRIIFMFGADGDRDTTKREEMGRIAAAGSQVLIVCDYHPRTEDPAEIRAALIRGARQADRAEIVEIADPKQAVRHAISLAGPGDVILYAGPGHEQFQEVNGQQLPYSARDEVRGALREAGLLQ